MYRVFVRPNGFRPGVDISMKEFEKMQNQFAEMYNIFCDRSIAILDAVDKTWKSYERILESGDLVRIRLMEQFMDIPHESNNYAMWLEKWYKYVAEGVNNDYCKDYQLEGFAFMDNKKPMYGVRFKDNPEWTMDLIAEPME